MKQVDIARAIRAAIREGLSVDRIELEGERVSIIFETRQVLVRAATDTERAGRAAAADAALKLTVRDLIELGKSRAAEEKKIAAW